MRSRLLILAAALSMSACSSDPTPAPQTLHASPTADVRAAAVRAYLLAAGTFNGQTDAVQRAMCAPAKTVPQVKNCWMLRAEIEHTFNTTVRAIVFPIDVVPTIRSLLIADTRLEAAMAGLGGGPGSRRGQDRPEHLRVRDRRPHQRRRERQRRARAHPCEQEHPGPGPRLRLTDQRLLPPGADAVKGV